MDSSTVAHICGELWIPRDICFRKDREQPRLSPWGNSIQLGIWSGLKLPTDRNFQRGKEWEQNEVDNNSPADTHLLQMRL